MKIKLTNRQLRRLQSDLHEKCRQQGFFISDLVEQRKRLQQRTAELRQKLADESKENHINARHINRLQSDIDGLRAELRKERETIRSLRGGSNDVQFDH